LFDTLTIVGRDSSGVVAPVACGRAAAGLARQVEVGLSQVDLSLPQYRILMFLDEGTTVPSQLADHLAVSRPTITSVVDGLVARGLVERRHQDDDRRRVGHALTPAGRRLLEVADRKVDARLKEIATYLDTEAQVEKALEALDRWRQALEGYRAARMGPPS
jgi:long-chain acyl-CoA synthetase